MWKSPVVKEVAVGLEINCYACAEIQKVADRITGKGKGGTLIRKEIISLNPGITVKEITLSHENEARESLKKKGILIMDDDSFTMKAKGGPIKKKKKMAMGGTLKNVPSGNKGLGKLPTPVRNKMGYKAYGGKAMKTYAKGGGMRKARTYG